MLGKNNNFIYYGLFCPTQRSHRIIHIRCLGFKVLYKTVKFGCFLDKILTRVCGEPSY